MAKKKTNKQPWSSSLESREAMYKGINPSADFDPLSIATQTVGYLGGFRTGKGMPEDEARWAAYLGLPYDKTYAPDTKIRFEGDENYPDRQYQGLSKRAKNEVRKKIIPQAKRIKDKYNKEWIQVLDTKPNSEYNYTNIYHDRQNYLGDLGKFGIREVGESGIYEVGDKYDFPALIPIPNRNEGTELMIRDTIWSDRANPELYNQEIIKRNNKYSLGSWFKGATGDIKNWNEGITNKLMGSNFGQGLSNLGIKAGGLGGIANTAATAIGGLAAGGRSTAVGNAMQKIGSLASNIPGVGGLIGAGVNLLGGVVNGAFGSKLNAENIASVEGDIKQALNFTSNAGDYDALASNYAGLQGVRGFNQDFIGKDGWWGGSKAKNKFNSLKEQAEEAEQYQLLALANNAQNIANTVNQNLLANYSAYGGPIDMKYTGIMSPFGNQFKDGGIYIKPSKRGTFTAAAKKRGMGVQEFASKVLANKEDYSPAMVKKANFARNASKWKHDDGGPLEGKSNGIPTQEEYISQQIAAKRAAALDKSRNRTSLKIPMIPNPISEDAWRNSFIDKIDRHEKEKDKLLSMGYTNEAKYEQAEVDRLTKKYIDGYESFIPGPNCLYNASDCYNFSLAGNQSFAANPSKYGFKKANKGSMEPGDIVQDVRTGIPIHAMIYDSKDTEGNLLFNYARGNAYTNMKHGYVKQGKYPLPIKDLDVYKYVGTPADSTQWINEYKEMYNEKADGGSLDTRMELLRRLEEKRNRRGTYGGGKHGGAGAGSLFFESPDTYSLVKDTIWVPYKETFNDAFGKARAAGLDEFMFDNKLYTTELGDNPDNYRAGEERVIEGLLPVERTKQVKNKKADGGFTNNVTTIGNGGTHEDNPYEGVQMGVDPQGVPNLVEEGEVIYKDYVYSNRLRVPKEVRQKYKLRGVTFADAAKQLQKESEERPNDPISKNGLDASMSMLQQEQEAIRMKKESNKYAKGGKLGTLYEGEGSKSNWLRYAPIAGHAIGAFSDLFSSPDYSAAETIEAVDIIPATVGYTPVGNYLSYKPFDRDYYSNKLNADASASRRAITNTSGGNRAAAMAGLLAADYNYGNQLGTLARQAEEYNQALRERVEGFNRQTNLANTEMGLKAAMANAESRNQANKLRLSQAGSVAAMRKAAKDAYDARRSNNINVLLEELGGLGTENWNRDWLDRLAKAGVLKIDSKGNPVISSAKGGKIRTKKKKGFTYG